MKIMQNINLLVMTSSVMGLLIGVVLFMPVDIRHMPGQKQHSNFDLGAGTGYKHDDESGKKLDAVRDLDSQIEILLDRGDSPQLAELYQEKARAMVSPEWLDSAIDCYEKALQIRTRLKLLDDVQTGNLYLDLANAYQERTQIAEAVAYVKRARSLAAKLDRQTRALINAGKLDQAEEICLFEKRAAPATQLEYRANLIKQLCFINQRRRNMSALESYARQLVALVESHPEGSSELKKYSAWGNFFISKCLHNQKKFEASRTFATRSIDEFSQFKDEVSKKSVLNPKVVLFQDLSSLGLEGDADRVLAEIEKESPELAAQTKSKLEARKKGNASAER